MKLLSKDLLKDLSRQSDYKPEASTPKAPNQHRRHTKLEPQAHKIYLW